MSELYLPPKVRHEIQRRKWEAQRAEHRATVERLIDFDDPVCREWGPVLRRLDPYLRLGRAKPLAYAPGLGVRAGFYHWVRDNPTTMMTVTPITGPDGESFADPDSRVLRELEANDLQNPLVDRALIARRAEAEAERERLEAEEERRMDEEVYEHWLAASRTQVLMSPDVPWAQNSAGRKRRERKP